MDKPQDIFLLFHCLLQSLLGFELYRVPASLLTILGPGLFESWSIFEYFGVTYPIFYLLLIPVIYNFISVFNRYLYIGCWVSLTLSIWIKILFEPTSLLIIPANILIVIALVISIVEGKNLTIKYMHTDDYFFSFNLVILAFAASYSIKQIFCLLDEEYHSLIEIKHFQLFEGILSCLGTFGYILFNKDDYSSGEIASFLHDCKKLIKNSDDFVFYLSISCQIGLSFTVIFDMYGLLYLLLNRDAALIRFHMVIFIIMIGLGGYLVTRFLKVTEIGVLAKCYMGISVLLMVLLNNVLSGPAFNYFLVSVQGFTLVPLVPLLNLLSLQTQNNNYKMISLVFVYWFGVLFFLIFEVSIRLLLGYFAIFPSNTCSFIQVLTFTLILSVYDERIAWRDSKSLLFK